MRGWLARAAPGSFVTLCLVVVALTFRDYGINWDDHVQLSYGQQVAACLWSWGGDRCAFTQYTRFYGPLFELFALAVQHALRLDAYAARHLATAFAGLVALYGVYRIGLLAGLGRGSLLAAVALALMPRFYGQSFVNTKDLPFATAVVLAMWAGFAYVGARGSARAALVLGLALGLAMAIRPGGLPIVGVLLALPLLLAAARGWLERVALLRGVLVVMVLSWAIMIALWPFAWSAPLTNPVLSILAAYSFPMSYPVLFEGHMLTSTTLPGRYLLEFLLITVPIPWLALGAVGLYAALRDARRAAVMQACVLWAIPCWLLLPYLLGLLLRPNVYDGMRHVLFTLPALAVLVALGARELVALAARFGLRWLAHASLALALAAPVASLVRLHPYETTYFNAFVGGVGGASGRYETEYFLLAYREAAEWINGRARARKQPTCVLVAADDHGSMAARHFLAPGVQMDTIFHRAEGALPARYAYYLGTTRYGFDRNFTRSKIVHAIGRDGAVFAVVRARE